MMLHSAPGTRAVHARNEADHRTLQRRLDDAFLWGSQRYMGERRALSARQAAERAAMGGLGIGSRAVVELRHWWESLALAARSAVGSSSLERRGAVDFTAQERMHAWDEGFRLPF